MDCKEEKLARVGKLFRNQLLYIQRNGCRGIKCNQCCLMNICTREPVEAKDTASKVLHEACSHANIIFQNKA